MKVGDMMTIQVHSVVKTFGDDTSAVIGKSYRITFHGVIAQDYSGDIVVVPVPEKETGL